MSQKIKNLTYKNLKLANPITRKDMKYLITLILFRQQIFKYIDKLLKIITTHQEKKKKQFLPGPVFSIKILYQTIF